MKKKAKSQNRKAYVKRGAASCRKSYTFLSWSKNPSRRCRYRRHIVKDPVFPGEKREVSSSQD